MPSINVSNMRGEINLPPALFQPSQRGATATVITRALYAYLVDIALGAKLHLFSE